MKLKHHLALALAGLVNLSFAASDAPADAHQAALETAFTQARLVAKDGPSDVTLTGQAHLRLPQGYVFVPQPQAGKLLNAMGNPGEDPRLQGLIFPGGDSDGWFMTVRFDPAGYIKDDDAKDWNADELLQSYRDGTAENNEERRKLGVTPLVIDGWAEKPAYDAATHRLVWAMSTHEEGAPASEPRGVNYNTYALGREGYFSMNLVTGLDDLPTHKADAHTLLAALEFDAGKRYADFDPKTDKVAEYGLAALVAGVAAKKLGLLALAAAFFAKFAKLILFGVLALGGLATKLLRRKKEGAA